MPKGVYIRAPRAPKQDDPGIVRKVRHLYRYGRTQSEIAAKLGVSQKVIFGIMRRNGIAARKAAPRDQHGENNANWRGDQAGYAAFHKRLYALHGKPNRCATCHTTTAAAFDYANLTGRYEDLNDYAPMCRSCHWRYDGKHRNLPMHRESANA
jgi:hypothetical protein